MHNPPANTTYIKVTFFAEFKTDSLYHRFFQGTRDLGFKKGKISGKIGE